MNSCDICGKTYKRRDNMLRHKRNVHSQKDGADTDDADTDDSMEVEQKHSSDESDCDDEASSYDPWDSLIQKAFEQCQEEFEESVFKLTRQNNLDESVARGMAYENLRSTYRKALANNLCQRMMWFIAIQKDRVFNRIRKTMKDLIVMDDYSKEEAWKYAISKRKFLMDSILEDFDPPSVHPDNDRK